MKTSISLIVILSVVTSLLSSLPLLNYNIRGIFYALDPDVTYLGNVLSYIKHHNVYFFGHPGTPTIGLLSIILIPLRIIKDNFFDWSFSHLDFLYLYTRLGQSILLGISLIAFLLAVYMATRSRLVVIFSWTAVLTFSFLPYLGSSIIPETTSFLIVSIWLLLFSHFNKTLDQKILFILSFIAGVATGNKLINAFLIIASAGLSFLFVNLSYKSKIKLLFFSLASSVIGFVWSTWPVRSSYYSLLTWATKLFISSDVHAQGSSTVIDPNIYWQSVQSFISTNPIPSLLILTLSSAILFAVITKKEKVTAPMVITSLLTLGCILVFFKYTLSYYQLMPYIVVVYLLSCRLASHKPLIFLSILICFLYGLTPSFKNYLRITSLAMKQATNLTEFFDNHSSNSTTVWEWGASKQFVLLWGQPYGQAFSPQEIAKISPGFYQITDNFNKLTQGGPLTHSVFDICWQHLYIQQTSVLTFFNKYPDHTFITTLISGTNPPMALVKSDHCP